MIYEFNPNISKMDEFKAEMQVLMPVLKAVRAALGEVQANRLIQDAVRGWCRERFKVVGATIPGTPKEKWDVIKKRDGLRTSEHDLEFEILRWDAEAIDYDVSRCKYAEFFREIGEPELGAILVCDSDLYLVEEVTGSDVAYTRTHSIMEGASCCDIRWRIKKPAVEE